MAIKKNKLRKFTQKKKQKLRGGSPKQDAKTEKKFNTYIDTIPGLDAKVAERVTNSTTAMRFKNSSQLTAAAAAAAREKDIKKNFQREIQKSKDLIKQIRTNNPNNTPNPIEIAKLTEAKKKLLDAFRPAIELNSYSNKAKLNLLDAFKKAIIFKDFDKVMIKFSEYEHQPAQNLIEEVDRSAAISRPGQLAHVSRETGNMAGEAAKMARLASALNQSMQWPLGEGLKKTKRKMRIKRRPIKKTKGKKKSK